MVEPLVTSLLVLLAAERLDLAALPAELLLLATETLILLSSPTLLHITLVSDEPSRERASGAADGDSSAGAPHLVTDDRTETGAESSSGEDTLLAIAERLRAPDEECGEGDDGDEFTHI
jgi:hypothetical protein